MRPLENLINTTGTIETKPLLAEETESGISLQEIFRMLVSHWLFILVCVVACLGGAYIYVQFLTPIYEAGGTMRMDPGRAGSLGLNALAGGGGASEEIATEIAIIQSDSVAFRALNMLTDEEFRQFAGAPRSQLSIPEGAIKLSRAQENLLLAFKNSLKAGQVGSTQLISVRFRSPNPQLAAAMVNDAMAAYLKESFDSRYGSVAQVRSWLSTQMTDLRNQSIAAQNRLTQFQEQNGIIGTSDTSNTTLDALKVFSDSLTRARADRLLREAQLQVALSNDPHVVASVFPSPQMSALEAQRSSVLGQINQLSSKFGEGYPPLIEARRELQKIDSQFDSQLQLIKRRVQEDYDLAAKNEKLLQTQYDEQLSKAYALNRQEATFSVLQSETRASRDLYEQLERSLQQAGITAGLNAINTMLVDTARAPLYPVEPKKTAIMGFALMLGLFSGLGAAFLKETITDRVKGEDQVERIARTHVLAVVPHISPSAQASTATTGPTADGRILNMLVSYNSPLSRAAEAFRTLRNSVLLAGTRVKTVLIASTIAGEGKSTTTANFAVALAQNGAKVLVVEADLRRPRLHVLFGLENLQGLSNLILGEDIPNPIHQPLPSLPNLSVITAGRKITLPAEALSSPVLHSMIEIWEKEYDFILVDSAPLLVVSDSFSLANWADAVLLVARYDKTPVAALRRVRARTMQAQANLIGIVLNDLPIRHASYGDYRSGYGYYE